MKRTAFFSAATLSLFLSVLLSGHQPSEKKTGLDFGQRYLVLGTIRTSTMQKELNQAAAAGYRVLAGWLGVEEEELVMLLEKVTAPPNTYEYLLLATRRSSTMQKEMREAGVRGFRLVPHSMVLKSADSTGPEEMVLVMEKAPGSSNRYDYLFLTDRTRFVTIPSTGALDAATIKKENLRAFPNGYAIVGELPGRNVLIAEKPAQPDADVFQNRAEYLLLKTGNGSDLEKELADAGERGFDVVGASHTGDMVILRKAVGQIAESPGGPAELLHPDHARLYASYSGCPKGQKANGPRCTIYIQPMGGWEGYVAAAFSAIVPVVMVSAREDADFEVLGTVKIHDPSTARKVGETAAGVLAIITQSGSPVAYPRTLEVTLSVRNTTTGVVMPEHSVRKEIYEVPEVSVELRAWAHKLKEKILESMPK